jgi:hypothetical protein
LDPAPADTGRPLAGSTLGRTHRQHLSALCAASNRPGYPENDHCATIGLSCSGGSLRFTVTDDGAGFDTASTRHGTGLQGMADRLAALGGALGIRSRPGHGTTLTGQLPVSAP